MCVQSANRPEYTRLKSVMEVIRDHPDLELFSAGIRAIRYFARLWSTLDRAGAIAREGQL